MAKPNKKKNYASVVAVNSKSFAVVDSANQCLFLTTSEKKAHNFLAKVLKNAGY
jgi:hypothetical protein